MKRTLLISWILLFSVACGAGGGIAFENKGFEIDCDGTSCGWITITGNPLFQGTWHPEDVGLDLSTEGAIVVEQRTTFEPPQAREYVLEAAVLRPETASLSFELEWFGAGGDGGVAFLPEDRLRLVSVEVKDAGLQRFEALTSVPDGARGLILRIVKSGTGRTWVDELRYHPPEVNR